MALETEQESNRLLYRTNYFKRDWTWVRRIAAILFLGIGAFLIPFGEGLEFLNLVLAALLTFAIIVKPKDDLALSDQYLLHIRRSAIEKLTRIDRYKIAELNSIRCGGVHSDGWELIDLFNGGGYSGGHYNTVEMSLKNGDSKSLNLAIDRKKLDDIVQLIYELKQKEAH